MMTAETAYNVIQALPKKEMPRLFKMLKVKSVIKIVKPKEKEPLITDAQATEYLLRKLYKK